ncbi:hypothetical protein EGW08_008569 [Elysia chlorotica]|uniref:Uncharacterized protein n=1 Tax=Elysia chlorotica TaxID=188477 RepID=A0A3S0ZQT3_ELYCH|nr:hypothetical protein EGW08_008569 [Elysia chlorotica]
MPRENGPNLCGNQAKSGPVIPKLCLTLPDGMSLTSVVLESIGSNGCLLTGPASLPWRKPRPGGASLNPRSATLDGRSAGGVRTKLSTDYVDNANEDSNPTPNGMLNMVSALKPGSYESGSSSKAASHGGSLWGKVRGVSTSSQSETSRRMSKTAAVLTAIRPRRGMFHRVSRLAVPLSRLGAQAIGNPEDFKRFMRLKDAE